MYNLYNASGSLSDIDSLSFLRDAQGPKEAASQVTYPSIPSPVKRPVLESRPWTQKVGP